MRALQGLTLENMLYRPNQHKRLTCKVSMLKVQSDSLRKFPSAFVPAFISHLGES